MLNKAQAMAHRSPHPVPALPLEILQICVALRRDLEDTTAVALRQALAHGATWKEITEVIPAAESTLKSHYSVDKVNKMLRDRVQRGPVRPRQPTAPKDRQGQAPASSANGLLPGQAAYPLSRALSYLRRGSETTVCSLAFLTNVSASYIYRITSGERTPTWEVTVRFARVCEAQPEDLMFLWNRAHSLEPPPARGYAEAVRTLQAALRGLRLAASHPDLPTLMRRAPASLTSRAATALLADEPPAACYLRWPVVRDLTLALQGNPETIRPLWTQVESHTPTPRADGHGPPAAAFG
ncbi:helix-turn-helix domain-containing protein [Streptomyces lydicus]|uniref:helix-turn-helix domain-containing protein n=1 Tax=Streptomyces lydicus TaxID=47763 RepID=UPI0036F8B5D0